MYFAFYLSTANYVAAGYQNLYNLIRGAIMLFLLTNIFKMSYYYGLSYVRTSRRLSPIWSQLISLTTFLNSISLLAAARCRK